MTEPDKRITTLNPGPCKAGQRIERVPGVSPQRVRLAPK